MPPDVNYLIGGVISMSVDQFAYWLKQNFPEFFSYTEVICGYMVYYRYRARIEDALKLAHQSGSISGRAAHIRPLRTDDLDELMTFFKGLPETHFAYFRPHGFSRAELVKVLKRPYYLKYGLFLEDKLVGYSLYKLYPGRKAFFGRMLSTSLTGCGLGKYLSLYLQWQSRLLGFRMRGTINLKNSPSVNSHKAVGGFEILGDLPNGYTLIEFPMEKMPEQAPVLDARRKEK
jgi:hypothetical protein